MFRLDFLTLMIVSTGAFFYWAVSGFKGKFNDFMSAYYHSDTKYEKNFWTGFLIIMVVIANVYKWLS